MEGLGDKSISHNTPMIVDYKLSDNQHKQAIIKDQNCKPFCRNFGKGQ